MTVIEKELVRQMRFNGNSYSLIATSLGISVNTIKSYCRRNNLSCSDYLTVSNVLSTPKTDEQGDTTCCKQCLKRLDQDSKFKPKKFCSDKCRRAWWKVNNDESQRRKAYYELTCECCGKEFKSYGNKDRKYCSHACYITSRFKDGEHYVA